MVAYFSQAFTLITLVGLAFAPQTTDAAFLACATAPAIPGDRRPDNTTLTFTTYNTEFLFLNNYGALDCPGADCKWTNVSEALKHISQVGAVIKTLNSDILQLNEVEDCEVLNALIAELELLGDDTYVPYLVRGTDTATGQNAALLTRVDPIVDLKRTETTAPIPVANSTCPTVSSSYSSKKGVSKHFYTTFNVSGFSQPITLIGAHLLANPEETYRCYEREGQATVLAGLANSAIAQGYHAIISGDINDWSATFPDKNNNLPISSVLAILSGSEFVQTESFVEQDLRYSEWWDENENCNYEATELSSLDHILVSKSLADGVTDVKFNTDIYTASCSGYGSDHYPITITINPV